MKRRSRTIRPSRGIADSRMRRMGLRTSFKTRMRTFGILLVTGLLFAEDAGKIMRPSDGAALPAGVIDVVATAPGGKLELDGKPLEAEQPFPNVFHANVKVAPGVHSIKLVWEGGG